MLEMISPYQPRLSLSWVMGRWDMDTPRGLARLSGESGRQASMNGYLGVFAICSAASAAVMLLVLPVRVQRSVARH
jgi:hypothetical protein